MMEKESKYFSYMKFELKKFIVVFMFIVSKYRRQFRIYRDIVVIYVRYLFSLMCFVFLEMWIILFQFKYFCREKNW